MNGALKLLSKGLRPLGYAVRPVTGLNFLRVRNLEGKAAENLAPASPAPLPSGALEGLDLLHVFFRTCVRENRNLDTRPRVTGTPMQEVLLRCLHSLLVAIRRATAERPALRVHLTVLDDRSHPPVVAAMRRLLEAAGPPGWSLEETAATGQGASLHEAFSRARALPPCLVHCIEDDYLHEPDAIARLCGFYRLMAGRAGLPCLLYPQEHPVMYEHHYPSYIVVGEDRHWRSIRHATHSFLLHSAVVRAHWEHFEGTRFVGIRRQRHRGSETRTTNRLFRHLPGFAPLRPLAVHLQFESTLPPLYDWRPLWEASRVEA